jgi:hypothetical protein
LLQRQPDDRDTIGMSLRRLDEILGAPLSISACIDRTWWGNFVNQTRVQAHAWLTAVWMVRGIDVRRQMVIFTRGLPSTRR